MATEHVDVGHARQRSETAPARRHHVFTTAEIESIKARTPIPDGTREERRARLHRALHTFASRREFTPAPRLLDRG